MATSTEDSNGRLIKFINLGNTLENRKTEALMKYIHQFEDWGCIEKLGEGGQGIAYKAINTKKFSEHTFEIRKKIDAALIYLHRTTVASGNQFEVTQATDGIFNSIIDLALVTKEICYGVVKVLHPKNGSADEKELERLKKEIEAFQAASGHPNILKILDFSLRQRGYVSQYMDEGNLAAHSSKYIGNVEKSLKAFRQIVDATRHLHSKKLIHRDIKPENIFVSRGNLALGDFGISFFMDESERVTGTYENVGSRDWMPQWAMGERVREPRPNFDIFSLGKLLWCMVSGKTKLKLWYWNKPEYSLEKILPLNHDIRFLRPIFEKCIVEEERDCLNSCDDLLHLVDEALSKIESYTFDFSKISMNKCYLCKVGSYVKVIDEFNRDNDVASIHPAKLGIYKQFQEDKFVVCRCENCGHLQSFYSKGDSFPKLWKGSK